MVARRLVGGLVALGFAVLALGLAAPASALPRRCEAAVAELNPRTRIDLNTGTRVFVEFDGGPDLIRDVAAMAPVCGRYAVAMLARELQDPEDLVRLYAAGALGKIGPAARSAVPALEAALKLDKCWCDRWVCGKGSWSSTGAIREAIRRITGSFGDDLSIYGCDYSGGIPIDQVPSGPNVPRGFRGG
jgi:hypothetical protein